MEGVGEPPIARPSRWAARERILRAFHNRVAPLPEQVRRQTRVASGAGDGLGGGTVVGHEVGLIHAEMRSCRLVGEVEDVKLDRYPTNATTHLEWIDSFIDKVTKELRPCALLPVGRVPNPRLPASVVAARPEGGVCTGCKCKRVPCSALVPVTAGQPSSRPTTPCLWMRRSISPSVRRCQDRCRADFNERALAE